MQYIQLLRHNRNYALMWAAQVISLVGDWFNTIVLAAVIARLTDGSGLAISLLLLVRFLPPLLLSPVAGVLLDRYDRRRMLIISDLARVFIVLGLLGAVTIGSLPLIYLLSILQFSFSAIFEPGRSALLPSLVDRDELVVANILGSITWSATLAIGGIAGGVVSGLFGPSVALLIDAASFGVSAVLIWLIHPRTVVRDDHSEASRSSWQQYLDGLRYARRRPATLATLLVKAGGNIGSLDTILIIFATSVFVLGQDGSGSLGILWCAFGVGAVLGPILVNRWNDGSVRVMRRLILLGYGLLAAAWFALAGAPGLAFAALAIIVRATGSSLYWTYSSAILQETVPDQYLGRIFSLDMACFQLMTAISIIITGLALEAWGEDAVRAITLLTGLMAFVPFILWAWVVRRLETHPDIQAEARP